jgi:hypothetical protein
MSTVWLTTQRRIIASKIKRIVLSTHSASFDAQLQKRLESVGSIAAAAAGSFNNARADSFDRRSLVFVLSNLIIERMNKCAMSIVAGVTTSLVAQREQTQHATHAAQSATAALSSMAANSLKHEQTLAAHSKVTAIEFNFCWIVWSIDIDLF